MSNVVQMLPNTNCPFEKRDRGHHEGFCDFLADETDQANRDLAKAEAIIAEIDRLSEAGITLSSSKRETYLAANATANLLRGRIARLDAALCYANEFMNA